MTNNQVLDLFKDLLKQEKINYTSAYLFGSRAKKLESPDSDWDFLVVLKGKENPVHLRLLKNNLRMKFHDSFNYPIDIIIKDNETFVSEQKIPNTIAFNAVKSGALL